MNNPTSHIESTVPQVTGNARQILIDGERSKTLKDFYKEISSRLNFPGFFSRTPDSFCGILINYDDYVNQMEDLQIVILNADKMFSREKDREKIFRIHMDIFIEASKYWQAPLGSDGMSKQASILQVVLVPSQDSYSREELQNLL